MPKIQDLFTGIVETQGKIEDLVVAGSNLSLFIRSEIASELKVDQSVAHDGVCLTVESIDNQVYKVTAIAETLQKTNLADKQVGQHINIERCLAMNGRLDGHIVQGHVDQVGTCIEYQDAAGSHIFRFSYQPSVKETIVEKGSITVNGISLTAYDVTDDAFSVAIIPYTFEHTNIQEIKVGIKVNLEFDIIGKYVARLMRLTN